MSTDMDIQVIALDQLTEAPYNPRTITDDAFEGLKASITKFGNVQPIVWNKRTGFIVSGHQRAKVLKAQGVTETTVVVVDLNDEDERVMNLSQNNPHISGEFTEDLKALLEGLEENDPDLFSSLRLDEMQRFENWNWDSDIENVDRVEAKDTEITSVIKVTVPTRLREEIMTKIIEVVKDVDGVEVK